MENGNNFCTLHYSDSEYNVDWDGSGNPPSAFQNNHMEITAIVNSNYKIIKKGLGNDFNSQSELLWGQHFIFNCEKGGMIPPNGEIHLGGKATNPGVSAFALSYEGLMREPVT